MAPHPLQQTTAKLSQSYEKIRASGLRISILKVEMKIAIVGAGVVGIATAYELADSGHQVTVYEKNAAASEAASFANGGIHSSSFTLPLTGSAFHGNRSSRLVQAIRQLSQPRWTNATNLSWLWQRSATCSPDALSTRIAFAQQMARLGLEISDHWIAHHQWEVEQSEGQLILLSNESELESYSGVLHALKEAEQSYRLLERAELDALEPALHGADGIFKAIHIQGDRVMNCRQFALLAKQAAQHNGTSFQFDAEVTAISSQGKPQVRLGNGETQSFDQVVVCTEAIPPDDLLKLSTRAPTARMDSYAVSVAIREPLNAPRSAVQDHKSGITISRIGKRLRVCGGAELNPTGKMEHDKRMVDKLFRTLDQHFPGAANYPAGTQVWRGSRTFTTDGLPVIGSAGLPGIWLNVAHGASGWSFATASARLLSEQIMGKKTSLPCELISPQRF